MHVYMPILANVNKENINSSKASIDVFGRQGSVIALTF